MVSWGNTVGVGIYTPPSWPIETYKRFLDKIRNDLAPITTQHVMVLGDFNAKSSLWGSSKTDNRVKQRKKWVADLDLRLLNSGNTSTCVRWQEESIVDVFWACPLIVIQIEEWKVVEDQKTLSDQGYIKISFKAGGQWIGKRSLRPGKNEDRMQSLAPRWALKKMNEDG